MGDGFLPFIQEPGDGGSGGGGITLSTSWRFDTGTADADPGNKRFRFDNATQSAAAFLFLNDTSESGVDVSAILALIPSGTKILMQVSSDATKFHLATTTGPAISAAGYTKLPITVDSSGVNFSNNNIVGFIFFIFASVTGGIQRRQFREIDITGTAPAALDPFDINTGIFDAAGAQTVANTFGTLVMPVNAANFAVDTRITILRNGIYQSKGVGRDVEFVSTSPPKIRFINKLKTGKDTVQIFSPTIYS